MLIEAARLMRRTRQRVGALRWLWPLATGRLRPVVILGHMRSGSSLLVHLLASNPGVFGIGEMHLRYRSPLAWWVLVTRVMRLDPGPARRRGWVLDKVLHDYIDSSAVLRSRRARWIVLVRKPEATLRSLMKLDIISSWDDAADHYVEALRRLEHQYRHVTGSKALVHYERLTTEPDVVLAELTGLLELREPLSANYRTNWATGRPGIGDPSRNIRAGRILTDDERGGSEMVIDPSALAHATAAFERFIQSTGHRPGTDADAVQTA